MSILSSNFFRQLQALEGARQDGITHLRAKGLTIPDGASIPAIIGNIPNLGGGGTTNQINVSANGNRIIMVAELPNTTISIYDSNNDLVSSQTTDATDGGLLLFTVSNDGTYTVIALDSDSTQLWTNTVTVSGVGKYNCYSGKGFDDYTWKELQTISAGGYSKYMFKCDGYEYKRTTFMGKSLGNNASNAHLVDFDPTDGRMICCFLKFATSYKHWNTANTNDNGISWCGSLIRTNCMGQYQIQYTYDKSVTSSTSGTYYKYESETNAFVSVTLPADYQAGTKYYSATTITQDGSFLASLKSVLGEDVSPIQTTIKTWGGYGINGSTDNTVIETQDFMWLPSEANIFGNSHRYNTSYSKYLLEGEQFKAFKEYKEDLLWFSYLRWFRSPAPGNSTYFAIWSSNGYAGCGSANSSCCAPLCFKI